jgi:hypothetical protein
MNNMSKRWAIPMRFSARSCPPTSPHVSTEQNFSKNCGMGPSTVARDSKVNTSFTVNECLAGGRRRSLHQPACQHTTTQPWAMEQIKKDAPHSKCTFVAIVKSSAKLYASDWRGTSASPSSPREASKRRASATMGALRRQPRGGKADHLSTSQMSHTVGHKKQTQTIATPNVQTQRSGGNRVERLTDGKAKYCCTPSITVLLCP